MIHSNVEKFDFRDHYFLPASGLHYLSHIYEQFAFIASESVTTLLQSSATIRLADFKQIPYSLFIRSKPPSCFHTLIELSPLSGEGIFSFPLDLCYTLIGKLLDEEEKPTSCPSLNNLQLALQRKFIKNLLDSLKIAWKNIAEMEFAISELSVSLHNIPHIPPYTKYLHALYSVQIDEITAYFSLALPARTFQNLDLTLLKEIILKDDSTFPDQKIKPDSIAVELKAILDSFEMNLSEWTQLQPGDIIQLNTPTQQPVSVLLEGQPAFKALPGLLKNQKGVLLL